MKKRIITAEQIGAFGAHLRREERAEATVSKYMREVCAFSDWLGGRAVEKERVKEWKARLSGSGKSPVTVNASLAAVHGFLSFMGWEKCRVRYLKVQRRLFRDASRDLSRAEYARLVESAQRGGSERLALLLESICGTGVRVSEVRYLTVEAARRGRADIYMKGKVRTILIPGRLSKKLLKFARKMKITCGEIFLTTGGKPMSRQRIWSDMKKLCKAAGVDAGKVFPHNLRHLFARMFYRQCRDIVQLADVLGHSSIDTTRIYLITTGAEYAQTLEGLGLVT